MGSEMCIRDRIRTGRRGRAREPLERRILRDQRGPVSALEDRTDCLLYTSDAADERSSVDLGGRRIIKKKKTYKYGGW